jgi:hypothetical protein
MRATIESGAGEAPGVPDTAPVTKMPLPDSAKLRIESWFPLALGLIAGSISMFLIPSRLIGASWRGVVLQNSITALSIFVAYLATAVTVIPAIEDKAIIKRLRRFGYLRILVGYISEAILATGLLLVFSIIMSAFPDGWSAAVRLNRNMSAGWWGLVFYSLTSVFRAVRLMIKATLAN